MSDLPLGFSVHVGNIGIKDDTDDFVVIAADAPCSAAAVFTQSLFAGVSVVLSREAVADRRLRAFAVISKNANVATGATGEANARKVIGGVASALGCDADDVLLASTGVIGRQYPIERVERYLGELSYPFADRDLAAAARGIMTTDTVSKLATAQVGAATVAGIAKGVGMIEPDMATLITLFVTDAAVEPEVLDAMFRRVIAHTFNAVSVDSDTSTSDTAAIMASGAAGAVPLDELETALHDVALSLTKMIARDGEGATKLIEVEVDQASTEAQAKRVAKAIVNSPLVKTAVHGADPNWGRVAMAVGKCWEQPGIVAERVVIRFGKQEVFPTQLDDAALAELSTYMRGDTVRIHVSLGVAGGEATFTAYGCDLSDGYVRINADYTT